MVKSIFGNWIFDLLLYAERVMRTTEMDQCMGGGSNNSTPSHNGNEIFDVVLHFGISRIMISAKS